MKDLDLLKYYKKMCIQTTVYYFHSFPYRPTYSMTRN